VAGGQDWLWPGVGRQTGKRQAGWQWVGPVGGWLGKLAGAG